MCGIAGVVRGTRALGDAELAATAEAMAAAVAHRGPDGCGTWLDGAHGVAFGHRRLAVYDPTDAGAQPMTSRDGRVTVVFNGAVYNHVELRRELEGRGHAFRGRSDTEVLVEALAEWGVEKTLPKLNGMFAFAAWDAAMATVSIARDRFGEKPLYYGWVGGAFVFGSGLRCIEAVPWFEGVVDRDALASYLRVGYVPAPASIYEGVRKLEPGTWASVAGDRVDTRVYWSALDAAEAARHDRVAVRAHEAEAVLAGAVSLRTSADVPLGAFLSGGVDSSLVVALMQAAGPSPVRTFTARFDERGFDEGEHARAVASHLGTDHTELHVTARDCLRLVPRLPELYDEPLADVSQVPTHLVAAEARRHVTVAMSGDGGDELFGGYNRHRWVPRLAALPGPVRRAAAAVGPEPWATAARAARLRDPDGKAAKLVAALRAGGPAGMYGVLTSQWPEPPLAGAGTAAGATGPWLDGAPVADQLMLLDAIGYLPGDVLAKVDGATMAVALEGRMPFLDHRVFELAWRLPPALRRNRRLLREVLYRHVPRSLVDRPKTGFDPPAGAWLRTSLRGWAEDLLAPGALARSGLEPVPVRHAWSEHLGGGDRTYALWAVLMFQAWASSR